jgi:hypothetical protein
MSISPQRELSPVSSQSAAETIRRLRREVLGLTLTVDALKKNSKEWVFLNSKLQVAREELDAVLEDDQLFRSISSSAGSDKMAFTMRNISEHDDLLNMIPTPPLVASKAGSDRMAFTMRNISEHDELLNMIPTPPLVASNAGLKELEDKLSQQVKYSLEWFQIKKQIDAKTKKCEIISNVSIGANDEKFTRPSTTGSIANSRRHEKLNKSPSMGTPRRERLTSVKDDKNIQCLMDQLDRTSKYSLEWFQLRRLISHCSESRADKLPKAGTGQRRKSNDAEEVKENSSPEKMATPDAKDAACDESQHNFLEQQDSPSKKHSSYNRRRSEDDNLGQPDGTDDHLVSSLSISDSSSASEPSLQSESQEKAHNVSDTDLSGMTDLASRANNELDTDLLVADYGTDQKAIQNMQKLQEFLERVPKYSR